jgi:hypothetical protein
MRLRCTWALVCAAAGLIGCAAPPKPLYLWENFTRQQYQALQGKASPPDEQIRELQAHVDKARASDAALPPGLRAHLGMLYLASGNPGEARQLWSAEKIAFPESAPYMNQLLKRLAKPPAP